MNRLNASFIIGIISPLSAILLWIVLKEATLVSDRFLPPPSEVLNVFASNFNNIWFHTAISTFRVLGYFSISLIFGIVSASFLFRHRYVRDYFLPLLQSIRAIPATATLPFFILWFGFSETGRFLVIFIAIATNICIAALQIFNNLHDKYLFAYQSYGISSRNVSFTDLCFFSMESLLPTLRFSLTVLIGVSVVAELLGAQQGLGYLIQGARTSYALEVLFSCAILYGVMTVLLDYFLRLIWKHIIPWRQSLAFDN